MEELSAMGYLLNTRETAVPAPKVNGAAGRKDLFWPSSHFPDLRPMRIERGCPDLLFKRQDICASE